MSIKDKILSTYLYVYILFFIYISRNMLKRFSRCSSYEVATVHMK